MTQRIQALEFLKDSISRGRFSPDSAVPSERMLAEELGISRSATAAALDEAEQLGIIGRRSIGARKRYVSTGAMSLLKPRSCGTVYVVGSLLPEIEGELSVPRWSDRYLAFSVISELSAKGRRVMALGGDMLSGDSLRELFERSPEAVVVPGAISENPVLDGLLDLCRKQHIPTVVFGNKPSLRCFDRVFADHREGGRRIAMWMAKQGCKRLLPLLPRPLSLYWCAERLAGYRDGAEMAGVALLAPLHYLPADIRAQKSTDSKTKMDKAFCLEALIGAGALKGSFDSILALTDRDACLATAALATLGLSGKVRVAGYDNMDSDPYCEVLGSPRPVATIDKHHEISGKMLVALLLDRLEGRLSADPEVRPAEIELVENTSI